MNAKIEKYFSGNMTREEEMSFFKSLKEDEALYTDYVTMLNAYSLSGWDNSAYDSADTFESWMKFRRDVINKEEAGLRKGKAGHRKMKTGHWRVMGYVAAASVAAVFTFLMGRINEPVETVQPDQVVVVPPGQRAQIIMPDGTRVWVNSNSTISYPGVFSGKERMVKLNGEAYFEVAQDEGRPFYVSTEKACVRVLGTHFDVFDYKGEDKYAAYLLEGKVDVQFKDSDIPTISLSPSEGITKIGSSCTKSTFTNEDFLLWRKGTYAFDDCRFEEIAEKMELYYDVKITVKNARLADFRFSGKFRQRDGIESILQTLMKLHSFKYLKDDENNIITIY